MPGNIHDIPLSVILTWPTPNYVDPVERTWMPAYAGTLQAVTTVMFVTRLVLRLRSKAGAIGLDDAVLIPGFVFGTGFTTLAILSAVRYGSGRHIWDVPTEEFPKTLLLAWLSQIAFIISTCCTKVSVLLFYRRLTGTAFSKVWKWLIMAAIAVTCAFGVAVVLVLIFTCQPIDAYWLAFFPALYRKPYHCTDTAALNPVAGVLSVVSDLYSVLLPMAMMRQLDIDRRKKIALNLVFSLGLLVVAAGAARTYFVSRLGSSDDLTWLGFDIFVWSELELQLALICACAPALRVLFRRLLGPSYTRRSRTRSDGGSAVMSNRDSLPLELAFTARRGPADAGAVAGYGDGDDTRGIFEDKMSVATTEEPEELGSWKSREFMVA